MTIRHPTTTHRAVTVQLAADLDGRYVEMRIVTAAGETIAVACPRDSIFAIQQHIEQIGRECPEIATWGQHRRPQQEGSGRPSSAGLMAPFKQRWGVPDCTYAAPPHHALPAIDMNPDEAAQKRA
jgi:hypothetical protein